MISIAMATYNGAHYVRQQLLSILDQSLPADEIIICDDGSRDATVSILREVMHQHPDRAITLVENPENLGYIANFRQAISLTRGDFIFLADQDDVWHPDKLRRMTDIMVRSGAALICTDFRLIDQEGAPITDEAGFDIQPFVRRAGPGLHPVSFRRLIFGNLVPGCTYCFTGRVRDAYLQVSSSHLIHDHQIMFISALLGKAYFLKEDLIDYRLHGSNAVGFQRLSEKNGLRLKKPSKKPFMVCFLEDLNRVHPVPHCWVYKLLYYFRIPWIVSILRRKFQ